VTGSSRGIGRSIALALAADGFELVVHCRSNIAQANEVVDQIRRSGCESRMLQFDVTDRVTTREILEKDMEENGAYYGIVIAAGTYADSAFPAMEDENWDKIIGVNLDGFYNVIRPTVMPMVQRRDGGRIVALSSVSGVAGNRGQVNYSAAKAGVDGAIKALALELAKRRITVNSVAPGLISTDMTEGISESVVKDLVPARRMGTPEEVASLVAYLFSEKAAYITRQVISVNGGMV
jgi:3-oxoacyl-[acyl-carrier protein] reductase